MFRGGLPVGKDGFPSSKFCHRAIFLKNFLEEPRNIPPPKKVGRNVDTFGTFNFENKIAKVESLFLKLYRLVNGLYTDPVTADITYLPVLKNVFVYFRPYSEGARSVAINVRSQLTNANHKCRTDWRYSQ